MPAKKPDRAPRRQTFTKAQMLVAGEWTEVILANVSDTGLMVKFSGGLPAGTPVEFRKRGTTISGEVVWSTSTRLGVRSFAQIDQSALLDAGLQPIATEHSGPAKKGWWHWRRQS